MYNNTMLHTTMNAGAGSGAIHIGSWSQNCVVKADHISEQAGTEYF